MVIDLDISEKKNDPQPQKLVVSDLKQIVQLEDTENDKKFSSPQNDPSTVLHALSQLPQIEKIVSAADTAKLILDDKKESVSQGSNQNSDSTQKTKHKRRKR